MTKRLNFKEMCERFEVTPRTLRYYEYIELLSPDREGRARFYPPREVARMKLIMRGRRYGFSLEEIRQWLEMYETEGSEAQTRTLIDMADRQLETLARERDEIEDAIRELTRVRANAARSLGRT